MSGALPAPRAGVAPVAPTVFHADGSLDPDGNRRVVDYLIDAGVAAICILANYSEQFALTDREREEVQATVLEHADGRVPVIVTTSHFSTRVAVERARSAESAGASMVMVMPPYHGASLRATPAAIAEHFGAIATSIGIPVMIQDAPLSGTELPVGLLAALAAEHPGITHVKVEVPAAADKLRALVAQAGGDLPGPWDGEESVTLLADLDAGATGTMPSSAVPDLLAPIVRAHAEGRRDDAAAGYAALLPLIHHENRQCGLRAAKELMVAGGIVASACTRHPLPSLPAHHREELLRLARERDALVLRWAS